MLFVLENEDNTARQANGQRAVYVDDCGTWSGKVSCKTHHYIISEGRRLEYVDKKDRQYVRFTKGKRIPVVPQPLVNVIEFKRYYMSLKRDASFKRRISIVTECLDNMTRTKNVAVVEYIGNYPQNTIAKQLLVSMCVPHVL